MFENTLFGSRDRNVINGDRGSSDVIEYFETNRDTVEFENGFSFGDLSFDSNWVIFILSGETIAILQEVYTASLIKSSFPL